jgi:polysaccharide biosynthesis protein PslG
MAKTTRRQFVTRSLAILGGAASWPAIGGMGSAGAAESGKGPVIGKIAPKTSKQIAASPLGVGFETLDRRLFDPERTYGPLGKLGVKWARIQSGWCRCETTKGKYDFAWLDKIVNRLFDIGIQPWMDLTYGNKLYMPDAPSEYAMGWAPVTETACQGWLRFVRALTEHYRGRIRHWEIWNEPNGVWSPSGASAVAYTELVKLTAPVIRANVPDAVVIGGVLGDEKPKPFHLMPYFQECLKAGMANYLDRMSFHPYFFIPEDGYVLDVEKVRSMLRRYKPTLDLWQGECGAPSVPSIGSGLNGMAWNESRQARWLVRRIINDLRLKIEQTSWFNVADQIDYSVSWREGAKLSENPSAAKATYKKDGTIDASKGIFFGLLRVPGYTPKPSYFAYQNLCALFDSQTATAEAAMQFAGDFKGGDPAVSVERIEQAAFVRNGWPLVAYWFPADVTKDMRTLSVDVALTVKNGLTLRNPVLVSPLNGEVSRLEGTPSGGQWKFKALPLTDYPMLITDAAVALPS